MAGRKKKLRYSEETPWFPESGWIRFGNRGHDTSTTYLVNILKSLNRICQNSRHKRKWSIMIYLSSLFFKVYFNSIFFAFHTQKKMGSARFYRISYKSAKNGHDAKRDKGYYGQIFKILSNNYEVFLKKSDFKWALICQNSTY